MMVRVYLSFAPPVPAPISGNAIVLKPCSFAKLIALRTDSRMEYSEERHHKLIPATWMIA